MECLGRYEIIGQLGQGTMGAVYKARDPMMDRDVAIKRILAHEVVGPQAAEFRTRFFREAKAAGRLAHPGIVTVFDVSEHENTPFLVMEYVAGQTLQSILQSGARMDLERVCDFGTQLAEALDYAHHNGVIHRDVKPANILITKDNRIKIADFGVAKLMESQLTSSGQFLGTPAFMAPEQFAGLPIDGRADLFALGVVIYWMATGDKPFTGDTILAVQYKVVHSDPVPPRRLNPAIPPGLEAVILKSIEKDPSKRYQTGEQLSRDLQSWRIRRSSGSPAEDRTELLAAAPSVPPVNARRVLVGGLLLVVLALVALALIRTLTQTPAPPAYNVIVPAESNPAPPTPIAPVEPQESAQVPTVAPRTEAPKAANAVARRRPDETTNEPPAAKSAPTQPQSEITSAEVNKNAVDSPQGQQPAQSFNPARLLIMSPAVPDFLTVIVTMDNELLFRREAAVSPQPQSRPVSTAALAEERSLPPGKHKLRVSILLAAQRVGRVHEIDERFYSGQQRTLRIQFSPENNSTRFSATLE